MKWFIVPAIAVSLFSAHASHHSFSGLQHSSSKVDASQVAQHLELSAQQQSRLKDLRFAMLKHMIQGIAQDSIDPEDHKKAFEHATQQAKAVLTKDQVAKLEAHGVSPHVLIDMQLAHEEFFARLQATDGQLTKLRALMKETHINAEKIQSQNLPRAQAHSKLMETMKAGYHNMKSILTPDQLKRAHDLLGGHA